MHLPKILPKGRRRRPASEPPHPTERTAPADRLSTIGLLLILSRP